MLDGPERVLDGPKLLLDYPKKMLDCPETMLDCPKKMLDCPKKMLDCPQILLDDLKRRLDGPTRLPSTRDLSQTNLESEPKRLVSQLFLSRSELDGPRCGLDKPRRMLDAIRRLLDRSECLPSPPYSLRAAPARRLVTPEFPSSGSMRLLARRKRLQDNCKRGWARRIWQWSTLKCAPTNASGRRTKQIASRPTVSGASTNSSCCRSVDICL